MRTTGGLATLRWEAVEAARTPGGKRKRRKREREGLRASRGKNRVAGKGPAGGPAVGRSLASLLHSFGGVWDMPLSGCKFLSIK